MPRKSAAQPPVEVEESGTTGPELLAGGTFAIYKTPRGGLVLVTEIEGRGVERKSFSPRFVKLAMRFFRPHLEAGEGEPLGLAE